MNSTFEITNESARQTVLSHVTENQYTSSRKAAHFYQAEAPAKPTSKSAKVWTLYYQAYRHYLNISSDLQAADIHHSEFSETLHRQPLPPVIVKNPLESADQLKRRTCGICQTVFQSRSALFKLHLNQVDKQCPLELARQNLRSKKQAIASKRAIKRANRKQRKIESKEKDNALRKDERLQNLLNKSSTGTIIQVSGHGPYRRLDTIVDTEKGVPLSGAQKYLSNSNENPLLEVIEEKDEVVTDGNLIDEMLARMKANRKTVNTSATTFFSFPPKGNSSPSPSPPIWIRPVTSEPDHVRRESIFSRPGDNELFDSSDSEPSDHP